jgi:hypothetical protein
LLVKREDRPVGISHEHKRWFKIEIESRLKTSRLVCDIGEDGRWEGVAVEIDDLRVIDGKTSIGIAGVYAVIIILTNSQLSSCSTELPVAVIGDCVEHIHESHSHL